MNHSLEKKNKAAPRTNVNIPVKVGMLQGNFLQSRDDRPVRRKDVAQRSFRRKMFEFNPQHLKHQG
jgi:hypothetical protein